MLTEHLTALEHSDLIRVAQIEPELEYLFRHALVQEVTYASLLRQDRKKLHRRVAETLEAAYPDRGDELAATLARHFDEAGAADRAFHYLVIAGDRAAAKFANQEALTHYARALALLDQASATSEQIIHLYSRYGRVLELSSQYTDAVALYRRAEAQGIERGDMRLEMEALSVRATIQSTPNPLFDAVEAQQAIERALGLAQALGDEPIQARLYWNMLLLHLYQAGEDHARQALDAGERSLAVCRQHPELVDQLAFTLNDVFGAYARMHQLEKALAINAEAQAMWRELGNIPMLVDSLAAAITVYFRMGDYDRVLTTSEEGFDAAAAINHPWGQGSTRQFAGLARFDMGEISTALNMHQEAMQISDQVGYPGGLVNRSALGMHLGDLGQPERGVPLAEAGVEMTKYGLQFMTSLPLAMLIRLRVLAGDLETAARDMERLLSLDVGFVSYFNMSLLVCQAGAELAYAQGDDVAAVDYATRQIERLFTARTRPYLADAHWIKGRALLRLGRLTDAETTLRTGIEFAESLGSKWNLWRLLGALAESLEGQGRTEEATAARQHASEFVAYVADHIVEPDLRASFLGLPEVKRITAVNST